MNPRPTLPHNHLPDSKSRKTRDRRQRNGISEEVEKKKSEGKGIFGAAVGCRAREDVANNMARARYNSLVLCAQQAAMGPR